MQRICLNSTILNMHALCRLIKHTKWELSFCVGFTKLTSVHVLWGSFFMKFQFIYILTIDSVLKLLDNKFLQKVILRLARNIENLSKVVESKQNTSYIDISWTYELLVLRNSLIMYTIRRICRFQLTLNNSTNVSKGFQFSVYLERLRIIQKLIPYS